MRSLLTCGALCLAVPALAGGLNTVTSEMIEKIEKNGDMLTEEATDAMLKSVGVVPATEKTVEDSEEVKPAAADTDEPDEEEKEVAEAKPVTPREAVSVCATCHGLDGIAKIPIAPHLAGESRVYLETQLKAFRSGKREHEMMTVIAKEMTDIDIKAASKWYAAIKISAEIPE